MFTERNQTDEICHFCYIVIAMLVHVNFVKLSSENNTHKMNTELKTTMLQWEQATQRVVVFFERPWQVY